MTTTYAVWNCIDKGAAMGLSNSNLTGTVTTGNSASVRADMGFSSGKWYWESTIVSGANGCVAGIANSSMPLSNNFASDTNGWGYAVFVGGGYKWNGGGGSAFGAAYVIGDVIGCALDMDNGTFKVYKNNVLQGTVATGLTGTWYPAAGSIATNAISFTTNFGASAMTYSPPAGYNAGVYTTSPFITPVNSQVGTFGGSGGTTTGIDTTGSNLIVVGINYTGATAPNISDNKSNTYTLIQTQTATGIAGANCSLYYCANPTVGSGHTFSTTSHFVNVFVLAASGAANSPLDQQNGAATQLAGSIATGSITPSINGCLVFTVFGAFNPGAAPTITSGGTGFLIPVGWSIGTSTSEAGAAAIKNELTAPAENVTWNSSSSPHATAIIASFLPAVPPSGVNNSGFFAFF